MRAVRDWIARHHIGIIAALIAYLPVVFSSPGAVGADTKTYLYLDPGKVLANASTLWDSDIALGTVTHQNIGFLWPMGPFYWLLDAVGSPDWLAQRIWIGSLLFLAGLGVSFLLRTLDWQGSGLIVAVLAYELSPYLLDYSARISAVLLPWVGLPWLLALTIKAVRAGGWRYPALFSLVAVTVGSVNATALLLVGLAPVLWIGHVVLVERSVRLQDAIGSALRIALLTSVTSLWWVAGLVLQGRYSLPVTRYTETYEVVADAATAAEILRGLGYWFFYGNDKFGAWIQPSIEYTQGAWLLFLSFGLVGLALVSATVVRWRHRSFFLLLLVVGALVGIGAHPYDSPSMLGSIFKDFTRTDAGLALRSTPRAVPLVVLATAVFLGALVGAGQRRWPINGRRFGWLVIAAIILANPAMWRIRMIEEHLQRDENLPTYWLDATEWLDENDDGTRVWEMPGSDFASYRWGNTVDPITPGLIERGFVSRELVPFGSPESANLLTAFDRKMQEGTLSPSAVVPMAQLFSVGEIVHRADLTFERFRTPRPIPTAAFLEQIEGLSDGVTFGEPVPNIAGPQQTLRDEVYLAIDPSLPDPSPVTAYRVDNPLDVIRFRAASGAQILVGDGEGIVDAAGAGVFDLTRPTFFAADLVSDPELAVVTLSSAVEIIITDTNRRRARRWGTLRENVGYTEQAGEQPLLFDPQDNRLEIFPAVKNVAGLDPNSTRTVSIQDGPLKVIASRYGNPVTYTLDDRVVHVLDGNVATAWTVADFAEARGEWLELHSEEPITIDHLLAVQPQNRANRHITEFTIRVDGGSATTLTLSPASWQPDGETLHFTPLTGSEFVLEITDLDYPVSTTYPVGISPVGFAELRLGTTGPTTEWIRLPEAFLASLGDDLDRHGVTVVLTRERSNPQEPVRDEPELGMRRLFSLSTERTFEVGGQARLRSTASPAVLDQLLGLTTDTGLTLSSTGSLAGDLRSRPSAALDGDVTTAFTGTFGPQSSQAWRVESAELTSIDEVALTFFVDQDHSVPTEVALQINDEPAVVYPTNLTLEEAPRGSTRTVLLPVTHSAVTSVRLEVISSADRLTRDWYSNAMIPMPFALAEVAIDDWKVNPAADIDTGCRVDLLRLNGVAVPVRLSGTAEQALSGDALVVAGCEPVVAAAGPVAVVTSGTNELAATGFAIDQLVLRSARPVPASPASVAPVVRWQSDVKVTATIEAADHDRWLVLGQSLNAGWQAKLDGQDLGRGRLIDGLANAWFIPAGETGTVTLEWTPQRLVNWALGISALAVLVAMVLAGRGRRDQPHPQAPRSDGPSRPLLDWGMRSANPAPVGIGWATWAGLAAGSFALLNLPSARWTAALVAVSVGVALRKATLRRGPIALATITFAAVSLFILVEQIMRRHPPDFIWPQQFEDVHVMGVLVILLVAGDYLRSAVQPHDVTN